MAIGDVASRDIAATLPAGGTQKDIDVVDSGTTAADADARDVA